MKPPYNPLIQIVPMIIIGAMMMIWPQLVLHYISFVLGLLLLIPSSIYIIRYTIQHSKRSRRNRRNSTTTFPYLSLLCALAGVAMMWFPDVITQIFIYLLGAFLIIMGGYRMIFLLPLRQYIPFGFFFPAILLILVGTFFLINPLELTENIIITLFGAGIILYGINELVYYLKYRH